MGIRGVEMVVLACNMDQTLEDHSMGQTLVRNMDHALASDSSSFGRIRNYTVAEACSLSTLVLLASSLVVG